MIKLNGMEIEFSSFPNGEVNMSRLKPEYVNACYNQIDFKYAEDADLIKLMFVKEYVDSLIIDKQGTDLLIRYMPYSRMDRSENNSPFTLKYISKFINSLNFGKVTIIEPHSDVAPALIDNSYSYYANFNLVKKVKSEISFNEDKDYIVFPDAGAYKRYNKIKAKNTLFCNKTRDFGTGEIKGLDIVGNTSKTKGNKALIVDDLSSYGGTFYFTAKKLREEGFGKIYLLITHAENSIYEGKLLKGEESDLIDKVFTTDTILNMREGYENKLKIYNIEGVLSDE